MAFQRFTEWTAKANHLLTVFPKWWRLYVKLFHDYVISTEASRS
jgi:hypothetical protein